MIEATQSDREDRPSPEPVGEDAQRKAAHAPEQDRERDGQPLLRVGEPEQLPDVGHHRRERAEHREAGREGRRAQRQLKPRAFLRARLHRHLPAGAAAGISTARGTCPRSPRQSAPAQSRSASSSSTPLSPMTRKAAGVQSRRDLQAHPQEAPEVEQHQRGPQRRVPRGGDHEGRDADDHLRHEPDGDRVADGAVVGVAERKPAQDLILRGGAAASGARPRASRSRGG